MFDSFVTQGLMVTIKPIQACHQQRRKAVVQAGVLVGVYLKVGAGTGAKARV